MEATHREQQEAVDQVYNYAATLFVNHKKSNDEVVEALMGQGLKKETAEIVANNVEGQVKSAKNSRAKKDMLYGALWCIGGTVLTLSHIGFIFWGAIVFGAIQFFKGVINL